MEGTVLKVNASSAVVEFAPQGGRRHTSTVYSEHLRVVWKPKNRTKACVII